MISTPIHSSRSRHNEQGIALVIVLGLLAVLVILGVSFSVSMRTERMATRSYVDVVKSRHLVHASFNRILDEHIPDELDGRVYPELDSFGSLGGGTNRIKLLSDRSTMSGAVFIPASLRPDAYAEEGNQGVAWLPLTDPITGTFYGEYAYLVVNCSGLLDANQIGGNEDLATPRNDGNSPAEIRFHPDLHPEADPVNYRNLDNFRAEFRKFESVSDLNNLCANPQGISFASVGGLPLVWSTNSLGPWADHLHVFSRFPRGYGDINLSAKDAIYIGGDPATWDLAAMKTAIQDLEGPTLVPNADHFLHALYDYADAGYEPYPMSGPETAQFQRFSSKPVPMVNEVIISNTLRLALSGAQQQLIHRIYVTVETWYPFPADPDNAQFSVEIDQPIRSTFAPPYPNLQQNPVQVSGPNPAQFNPSAGNGYNLTTFVFEQPPQNVNGVGQLPYPPPGGVSAPIQFPGNIRVKYGGNNKTVDMVFPQWGGQAFVLSGPRPALAPGGAEVGVTVRSQAVNDPRINWDPGQAAQWGQVNPPTPGARNNVRISSAGPQDEFDFMYARRAPPESIGELGYLLYDASKPWQTIRLIGEDPAIGAKLIDRFTVFTNALRRGLVNVNSRQTNALAATIWTVPVEKYPGAGGASTLAEADDARQLADHLIQRIATEGSVTNLSDLAERFQANVVDGFLGTANDKFTRESLIRNSIGLWGTRHQLFTIFVAARTFSDIYNPNNTAMSNSRDNFVTAEQRAVAVIWRDPFLTTNAKGTTTHQSFVQFFHWFSGAFGE